MRKVPGLLILVLLLGSCVSPMLESEPSRTPEAEPLVAAVTDTPAGEPDQQSFDLPAPDAGTVALDFIAMMCSAEWTNNGEVLSCPGDALDSNSGSVTLLENPQIRSGYEVNLPGLLTIPAHNGFLAIFGHYQPFTVQYGDEFHAYLTCASRTDCDVSFSLEYYDAQGNYHSMRQGFGMDVLAEMADETEAVVPIKLSLDSLAGLTVEFMLVVREHGEIDGDQAIWIAPHIYRDPDYTPPIIAHSTPTASIEAADEDLPGVISGRVDMSTAPPYLLSSYGDGEPSSPVVVVFFNLDDGTWWWIDTTLTHPLFQMTVPPGHYHVVAYAHGVADIPYVTGAYTGTAPSCGQVLSTVEVESNEQVRDIIIADWNWTCGGTAARPEKPDAVPIP